MFSDVTAIAAEPMEMLFGGLALLGPMNHVLQGVMIGRIHSQPRGVISRRCGLLSNSFGQLFYFFSGNHAVEYKWCFSLRLSPPISIPHAAANPGMYLTEVACSSYSVCIRSLHSVCVCVFIFLGCTVCTQCIDADYCYRRRTWPVCWARGSKEPYIRWGCPSQRKGALLSEGTSAGHCKIEGLCDVDELRDDDANFCRMTLDTCFIQSTSF